MLTELSTKEIAKKIAKYLEGPFCFEACPADQGNCWVDNEVIVQECINNWNAFLTHAIFEGEEYGTE